ncbi:arginine--tRNA ligase [Paenibacillus sp. MBLB4367]|uniref:arginine--tRNA ligase n=1 Tax=Paenibacillus sp. MBLB4367 TaxID=3384767 RepID=UPI0039080145
MISEIVRAAVARSLNVLLEKAELPRQERIHVAVEHPASPENGDYSTNVAMTLAKALRKPPLGIAHDLLELLQEEESVKGLFSKVEAAAPGFLNFYLDWQKWSSKDFDADSGGTRSPEKVIVEHTSINPNKSAHIGHLRNSCIGDTIARMMKRTGHKVEVHNYIDDLGNQLADTVVGMLHKSTEGTYARFGDFCWETYAKVNKAYKETPELQHERTAVLHELEKGSGNTAWFGLLVAERIVREHLEEMKQFGIGYDVLVWESSIVREGFWLQAFELLRSTSVFRQEEEGKLAGCWVLKQSEETEEASGKEDFHADKVLVRSNGVLTYTAKDIAYHLWKFGVLGKEFRYRKFADGLWSTHADGVKKRIGQADTVINVIDHRQEYPQTMVKQALQALGFGKQADRLKHVSYGVVSLSADTAAGLGLDTSDGKHAYPMSGRQGIGIKVTDLLNRMEQSIDAKRSRKAGLSSRAIAAAAIRYSLLRFHLQTEVVFDLEQATEISGNTGVYLLYAYARACSVLEKAGREPGRPQHPAVLDTLEAQEQRLLRLLAYWPETLQSAVRELSPNALCTYVYELASSFNHFYATCPILKGEGKLIAKRIWITERFEQTLRDALSIIGLPAPKRM